ncbi:MAG: LCP family protein [Actinomycetota bacterium]
MSSDSTLISSPRPSKHSAGDDGSNGRRRGPARWWKRLIIGLLVLSNLTVGAALWVLTSAQSAFRTNTSQIPEVVPELNDRPTAADQPITFLVIGSDSRAGLDSLQNFGDSPGARGDVIMLIKLYPATGSAQILSIPRDLLVEIPGKGSDRINAAYSYGGAALMVRTVKQVTGLPIHHYVEIDFVGFQSLVDEVGGVSMDFPYPARDIHSGLMVEAGRRTLQGDQALAYARSRSYEELRDGSWTSVDGNDFGRTRRQQQLILSILSALRKPSTLTQTGSIVSSFAKHLSVDSALVESSLIELAFAMRAIGGSKIQTATLPGYIDDFEGMSIVRMEHPEADNLIAAFGAGDPIGEATAETPLRLEVLNGNGVKGSATRWSEILADQGFEIAYVGDADRDDFELTTIIVRPEAMAGAQAIVEALGFGTVATGSVDASVDAVVIVGLDADRTLQSG